jgi:PAS domain S-box-containing protein
VNASSESPARLAVLGELLEGVPAPALIAFDPHGRELRVNEAFGDLVGVEPAAFRLVRETGPHRYRFESGGRTLAPEELPLLRALRGERVAGMRIDVVRADGGRRHITGFGTPFHDASGAISGAFCIFQDIGREIDLASLSPALLFTVDPTGNVDFVSARWTEVIGTDAGAMLGTGWASFLHPEDRARVLGAWTDAMREGTPFRQEYRVRRADGTYRWVEVRAEPARDPHGRIVRWFGGGTDIDERRRALDALRLLFESGPQLAADVDVSTMLRGIAQTALEGLADVSVVDLVDGIGESQRIIITAPGYEAVKRATIARFTLPPPHRAGGHPGARALAENRVVLAPRTDDAWMREHAPSAGYLAAWRKIGFHSLLAVPLRSSGRAIGSMILLRVGSAREPFDYHDAEVAEELGRRAGVALEKVWLAHEQERQFRQLADGMPQLMWTADAEGRVTWYNQRWYEYTGQREEAALLEGWTGVMHPHDVTPVRERWYASVRSGQTFEAEMRLRGRDGVFRWFLTRARPLHDPVRAVRTWIGTNTDIDDARRAERRAQVYARLGEALASSLGLQETLDAALRAVVPAYADWAFVVLADDHGERRVAAIDVNTAERRGVLERVMHATPGRSLRDPFITIGRAEVLCLPIAAGASLRGTLHLVMDDAVQHGFDRGELQFFAELARRVAPAIANAELYERERHVARTFQQAALPSSLPAVPGYTFDAIYEAGLAEAQVGGDWYDAFRLADGRIVVSIGDVAGSGLQAAVTMANVRQAIRGVAQVHADPGLMLEAADAALRAQEPERFVTAFVGVIEPLVGTLTFASAGHPPPFLRRPSGALEPLYAMGLPLGLRAAHEAQTVTVPLERGMLLVLYTDGLIEATRDVEEGEARLRRAIASVSTDAEAHPAQEIHEAVLGKGNARDDVAILTVAVHEEPAAMRWSFDVRDVATAIAVRRAFSSALAAGGYDEDRLTAAETILSELLGNALRYAPGPVDVLLAWDGRHPVLHVLDRGPGFGFAPKLPSDVYSEGGRGLFLIAALSDAFSVTRRPEQGSHARVVLPAATRAARAT